MDKPVAVSYAAENAGFTVLDEGLGAEQYGIAFRADDAELCKTIEGARGAVGRERHLCRDRGQVPRHSEQPDAAGLIPYTADTQRKA